MRDMHVTKLITAEIGVMNCLSCVHALKPRYVVLLILDQCHQDLAFRKSICVIRMKFAIVQIVLTKQIVQMQETQIVLWQTCMVCKSFSHQYLQPLAEGQIIN